MKMKLKEYTKNVKDIINSAIRKFDFPVQLICPRKLIIKENILNKNAHMILEKSIYEIIKTMKPYSKENSPIYITVFDDLNLDIKISFKTHEINEEELVFCLCPFYEKENRLKKLYWIEKQLILIGGKIELKKEQNGITISIELRKL
ncbi:MAG: hypothetical protein WC356_02515 [Candidatus Micrarchaeia archaeon]|jgi:hypothetical protein